MKFISVRAMSTCDCVYQHNKVSNFSTEASFGNSYKALDMINNTDPIVLCTNEGMQKPYLHPILHFRETNVNLRSYLISSFWLARPTIKRCEKICIFKFLFTFSNQPKYQNTSFKTFCTFYWRCSKYSCYNMVWNYHVEKYLEWDEVSTIAKLMK